MPSKRFGKLYKSLIFNDYMYLHALQLIVYAVIIFCLFLIPKQQLTACINFHI